MEAIEGEVLSISYEGDKPTILIELADGSDCIVLINQSCEKWHPIFKLEENWLFEGFYSANIDSTRIKLFFAESAINKFMRLYDLPYWNNFIQQFGGEDLCDFCHDASENKRNYLFCLNFHLAAFERFNQLAVECAQNANVDLVELSMKAARTTEGMIRSSAKDKGVNIDEIEEHIRQINEKTSFDIGYKYLEATRGKV